MSRIIQTQNSATSRTKSIKLIKDALADYDNNIVDNKDIAAYIVMQLIEIQKSVESTCAAWEKRDYWLKADRFRLEWRWVLDYKERLIRVLQAENWQMVGEILEKLNEKIADDSIYSTRKKKINFEGSWERFRQLKN